MANTDNGYTDMLIAIDKLCDTFSFIPCLNTLNNMVDLFQKCAVIPFLDVETVENNRYFTFLQNKSALQCIVLAVPVFDELLMFVRFITVSKWYFHNGIENYLIALDEFSDSIPFVSGVSNFIDLFLKFAVIPACHAFDITQNRFFEYIENKDAYRCIALLFPVIGNIAVLMHDLVNNFEETLIRCDENCDHIPLVSTFTYIIEVLLKYVIIPSLELEIVENSIFLTHIQQKSEFQLFCSSIPLYQEFLYEWLQLIPLYFMGEEWNEYRMEMQDLNPEIDHKHTLKQNGLMLMYANGATQKNFSTVLTAVRENGLALPFAHERLQANKTIVLAAVRQNWRTLRYARGGLNEDIDVLRTAIKQNPDAIELAGPRILNLWHDVLEHGIDAKRLDASKQENPEIFELFQLVLREKNRFANLDAEAEASPEQHRQQPTGPESTHLDNALPGEVMDHILSFLDVKDLNALKQVSRTMRQNAENSTARREDLDLNSIFAERGRANVSDEDFLAMANLLIDLRSLRSFTWGQVEKHRLHPNILKMIFQTFPNLNSIDLNEYLSRRRSDERGNRTTRDSHFALPIILEYLNDYHTINLSNWSLTDADLLTILQKNRNLENLDLRLNTGLTDLSLTELTQCQKLRRLYLSSLNVSEACLINIVQHCTQLSDLAISIRDLHLGNEFFEAISQHGQHFHILGFYRAHIDEQALVPIFPNLRNLRELDLGETLISSDTLHAIAQNCPQLRKIWLDSIAFTSNALIDLLRACTHLESLCIKNHWRNPLAQPITDETIRMMTPFCHNLRYLDLLDRADLSDDSLVEFAQHFPKLQTLDLRGCQNLTQPAIVGLRLARPKLAVLIDLR